MIPNIHLQEGLGNTQMERLHQKTSVFQPAVRVLLEGAAGEGRDRTPWVGG